MDVVFKLAKELREIAARMEMNAENLEGQREEVERMRLAAKINGHWHGCCPTCGYDLRDRPLYRDRDIIAGWLAGKTQSELAREFEMNPAGLTVVLRKHCEVVDRKRVDLRDGGFYERGGRVIRKERPPESDHKDFV